MMLSRDDILGADDRQVRTVAVPEWGGEVLVRAMSGEERDAFETSLVTMRPGGVVKSDARNVRAKLVAFSCVDAGGTRLFEDADVEALGRKSAAALERVFDVARHLSGLGEADVEELTEGFTPAPSEGSTSD